ncbi:hypothetical protein [Kordia sp.]|uniref:hypothetical protein n=1 Tax=Kordia sp. TaxID=1965332 RepID=UPI003B5967DC
MKIRFTILLVFIFTCNLLAHSPTDATLNSNSVSSNVVDQSSDAGMVTPTTIASSNEGGGVSTDKGELNSILGYSIIIFFSVLIIILIDNRNLEKRYKKLVTDFKTKDPLL